MCIGSCTRILTNYNTVICTECGVELEIGPVPLPSGSCNVPLGLSYSRFHRVANILDQLFEPQFHGSPSSRVICAILDQKVKFTSGEELLSWLSKLPIKNKKYQNAHCYFVIANSGYIIPRRPDGELSHRVLRDFCALEDKYEWMDHTYKSFFSYNWLLRKLLTRYKLGYYCQFLKTIKCPRRSRGYEDMLIFFGVTGVSNAAARLGTSKMNRTLPGEPRGGACSSLQQLLAYVNRSEENRPSTRCLLA